MKLRKPSFQKSGRERLADAALAMSRSRKAAAPVTKRKAQARRAAMRRHNKPC